MKRLFTALALCVASPALAEPQCGPTGAVLQWLSESHGEHMHARGFVQSGEMFGVFGNTESGTWTIVIVRGDGTTCLIAAGRDFALHDAPAPGTDG